MQTAILHPSQHRRGAMSQCTHAIECAIEQETIAALEQHVLRNPYQRPAQQSIVQFIHEILAAQQGVQRREPPCKPSAREAGPP